MNLFDTSRLAIRHLQAEDLPRVYRLLSDPAVMRYVAAPYTSEQQARDRMKVWTDYNAVKPSLGTFAMELKEDGGFAGFCVARQVGYNPESAEFEIGYIFSPECWGKGLATELVGPLSAYCFAQCDADHLVAFTDPDNAASQRVLTKNGFVYIGIRETPELISSEFHLPRT